MDSKYCCPFYKCSPVSAHIPDSPTSHFFQGLVTRSSFLVLMMDFLQANDNVKVGLLEFSLSRWLPPPQPPRIKPSSLGFNGSPSCLLLHIHKRVFTECRAKGKVGIYLVSCCWLISRLKMLITQ